MRGSIDERCSILNVVEWMPFGVASMDFGTSLVKKCYQVSLSASDGGYVYKGDFSSKNNPPTCLVQKSGPLCLLVKDSIRFPV